MLIKNAVLVDALGSRNGEVRIENGLISEVATTVEQRAGESVLDAKGLTLMPAFIDLHAHFRTPGYEYKEDITTGSAAAARGGYAFVNCMANTNPICSNAAIAHGVMDEAKRIGICEVNQVVSITENFDGKTLTHLEDLPEDIKVISEDGKGVQNNKVMWQAMQIAARKNLLVMSHAEDMDISPLDYRLAENIETARNIFLAKATGARLHMCHVSTKEALREVINAKMCGVRVTCEVTPHHIWFTDTLYRVNPPIRAKADVDFIIEAMREGHVDAIATDHAPHSPEDKTNGAPGMVGLETAFAVCNTKLVREAQLPMSILSRMMSRGPARIMGLEQKGMIDKGMDGDLVLVNPDEAFTVHAADFAGKSKNTPYEGLELYGTIHATIKGGVLTYSL